MSEGAVYHKVCGGMFRWTLEGHRCDKCGRLWDGKEKGVVTYQKPESTDE